VESRSVRKHHCAQTRRAINLVRASLGYSADTFEPTPLGYAAVHYTRLKHTLHVTTLGCNVAAASCRITCELDAISRSS